MSNRDEVRETLAKKYASNIYRGKSLKDLFRFIKALTSHGFDPVRRSFAEGFDAGYEHAEPLIEDLRDSRDNWKKMALESDKELIDLRNAVHHASQASSLTNTNDTNGTGKGN